VSCGNNENQDVDNDLGYRELWELQPFRLVVCLEFCEALPILSTPTNGCLGFKSIALGGLALLVSLYLQSDLRLSHNSV